MWELLPIQKTPGRPWTLIDRDFQYPECSEVMTSEWKNVPQNVREWSVSIWKDEFQLRRISMGPSDILAWIPQRGLVAMKRGKWIGQTESFRSAFVCFNYVDASWRGRGYSGKLICSLGAFATRLWGPTPFFFETHLGVPRGLCDVQPFVRFTYTWIPFLYIHTPPLWKPIPLHNFDALPGFHPDETEGYLAFGRDDKKILLDPHNDIVHYDDFYSLLTFDGLPISGAYVRVFSPLGSSYIFLENMYFDPAPSFTAFLLA